MKKKTIVFVCIWLFCLVGIVWGVVSFTNDSSQLAINGEGLIALNHEAVKAKISNPQKHPYLYFKLTKNQRARFSNLITQNGDAAIKVKITLTKKNNNSLEESPYVIGLLNKSDFDSEKKLKSVIDKCTLVTGNLSNIVAESFTVSMSIVSGDMIPVGFFLYGTKPLKASRVEFTEGQLGWDRSTDVPSFAFNAQGGDIDTSFTTVDLTQGKSFITPDSRLFPKIEIGLFACDDCGAYDQQVRVNCTIGSESISIRRAPRQTSVVIQAASLKQPFCKVVFNHNGAMVSKVMLSSNDKKLLDAKKMSDENDSTVPLSPVPTDLGLVLDWPQANWRCAEYELYSWEQFPQILFFDIANYEIQNKFFSRLAFFVEKAGYKGTLVSDEFIENEHGYNAHDYKAQDLAMFFTKAAAEKFTLNNYELLLRDILVYNKILIANKDGTFSEGTGGVISISRESANYLRNTFIAHESWHGIYFIDKQFRTTVETSYEMFDMQSMEFIKTFWATQNGLHYDINDDYLMKNEFMAYLMQQPCSYTKTYFLQVAGRGSVNQIEPERAK